MKDSRYFQDFWTFDIKKSDILSTENYEHVEIPSETNSTEDVNQNNEESASEDVNKNEEPSSSEDVVTEEKLPVIQKPKNVEYLFYDDSDDNSDDEYEI